MLRVGNGARSSPEATKGSLREGEVVGLSLYLQFFWDFVTGNRRKSLGIGVFFGGEGDSAQGKRKGRLGKSYVDGACGGWAGYGRRR
jgi:hypothetical protein